MARRLNLDGDGQGNLAGHGGEHRAVMVYQLESYRQWEEHLQRDDFEYGQFGANLTVDGLAFLADLSAALKAWDIPKALYTLRLLA